MHYGCNYLVAIMFVVQVKTHLNTNPLRIQAHHINKSLYTALQFFLLLVATSVPLLYSDPFRPRSNTLTRSDTISHYSLLSYSPSALQLVKFDEDLTIPVPIAFVLDLYY